MERANRYPRNIDNLFKPCYQGLTTYDLTYVTARNNEEKNRELFEHDKGSYNNGVI